MLSKKNQSIKNRDGKDQVTTTLIEISGSVSCIAIPELFEFQRNARGAPTSSKINKYSVRNVCRKRSRSSADGL